jgi:muconate cycloisomerase
MPTPRPKTLDVWTYQIPMRVRFEHARAGRSTSTGILVRLELRDGTVGWGEGIPRDYVTGETLSSAAEIIRHVYAERLLADAPLAADPVEGDGIVHNAAWCACELAYLDAIGKSRRVRVADMLAGQLGFKPGRRLRRVSAIISSGPLAKVRRNLRMMRLLAFRDYKLKVGKDAAQDEANLAECHRQLGRGLRRRRGPTRRTLRVDANGAWDLEEAVRRAETLTRWGVIAVEQPLAKGKEEALAELRRRTSVPIMLDESLLTIEGAERLVRGGQVDLFNIRISKNGGLVQSLRLAQLAHRTGVDFQLGCMVGETGILSAAGRIFLELVGRRVRFAEGSYGRFLLRSDVTRERLSFGYGGFVRPMTGPGLGVHVQRRKVREVARRVAKIEYL